MRRLLAVLAGLTLVTVAAPAPASAAPQPTPRNPVTAGVADTFADPAVIRGDDGYWYAYGTSDPLRSGEGTPHLLPILRSPDLARWSYVGDAFIAANRPAWATPTAGLWAPDIRRAGDTWLLYYTVTDTTLNAGDDSAIGVATAPGPTGPWTDSGAPLVGPRPAPGGGFLWTFDPAGLVDASGQRWLYYGSYFGGIWTVPLSSDGLRVTGAATQVTIDNRYEGAYVVRRGGWYYLFGSAANCCAGPTTGYSVFAGRSKSPTGPFVDRSGASLLDSRVGGTPVIQPNGNRWIGTGHNAVVTDERGRDWFVYHAIDRDVPYLDEPYGINRRPMLIDRLDWHGGWPTVRGGEWASDPGARDESWRWADKVRKPVWSDDFTAGLDPAWSWVRLDPDAVVTGGALRWPTQAADLVGTVNDAGVLLRDAPAGDYVVETKLTIDLGVDTVRNYQQAGLVVYAGDDDFARLSHVAIWNTRQIEYGRELPYAGRLSYGGMVETPPADTTWLRLAHRVDATGEHEYRAATSLDGRHWTWGGVWTFPAGVTPRIGLVSHGGDNPQATARFDYVRLWRR
ncbi:family 43 glycosylhydrolase [Asanoa sp. WMMD1127]|uniref:family 43 glycosylhydrolase n=1 Tax=Asanoa sp. WMMD1127 TaxID=3016107 RepID=UPI0024163761|nr:family 43 glycosylhydrolase [Asanoa sp. WMMD1127]MDG4826243.1 family 43 glycosylhydrolase [Asanoa sp. WMMD1127]